MTAAEHAAKADELLETIGQDHIAESVQFTMELALAHALTAIALEATAK